MFSCIVFLQFMYFLIRLSRFFLWSMAPGSSSSFLSKQPSVIRRPRYFSSGFWSKSLLGRYKKEIYIKKSGTRLFFHTVSSIVPSAVQVLTVVFGMGTGVAPARIGTRLIYLFIQIYDTLTEIQPLLLSLERR